MRYLKVIGIGIVNYLIRFAVGGILFMVVKMDPIGFRYGFILTLTSLIVAYVLLKYVMRPATLKEALKIAFVWVIIAIALDMITAEQIVNVTIPYLFSETQTWTRLAAIFVAAFFGVRRDYNL